MNTDVAIRVENLSKVYSLHQSQLDADGNETRELWALKDVSFEIKKGESVGIIGPNGSGKSTLLKILAGVTKPSSGKVTIKGKTASILDVGAGFHPELSGRENVFLNGQLLGFSKKEIQAKFDAILDFSGIERFIDEPVKNYSSGMYLRLAFSIVVNLDFEVYLLDEVLSVGDADFMEKAVRKIQSLTHQKNKTILLISHNINELHKICRSVFVAGSGKLSEEKTLEEAMLFYGSGSQLNSEIPDFVSELAIRTLDDKGIAQAQFLNDQSISIELKNIFLQAERKLNLGFRLKDQFGNVVFSSSPVIGLDGVREVNFQENKLFLFEIPPLFFNEGKYFIDVIYFDNLSLVQEVGRFAVFSVKMNPVYQGNVRLGEKGPVKPIYNWIVK